MPYRSEAQRRFFHHLLAQGKLKPEIVAEFDEASKGLKLPERVAKKSAAYEYGWKLTTPENDEAPARPSWLRRHAVPLAGLAAAGVAAPLLYHHLRKRTLSDDPALRAIQEASGGKFTRVVGGAVPGRARRAVDRLIYGGGGDVRYTSELRDKIPHVPGVVMHDQPGQQWAHGDINLVANAAADHASEVFHGGDKLREWQIFNHVAPGAMARSEGVADVLAGLGHDVGHPDPRRGGQQAGAFRRVMSENGERRGGMFDALEAKLRERYPHGYLLKDNNASATGGKFPSDAHHLRDLAAGDGPAARTLVNVVKDPRSVMVQEKLPLAQGSWLDRQLARVKGLPATQEVRVHVMNGAVVPHLTVPRFAPTMAVTGRATMRGADAYARDLVGKLPEELRQGSYAMDVAPLQGGGYKLIESNPGYRSGFMSPGNMPLIGPKSHKAFTGQHSQAVAGLGAAAGAGVAALGARAVAKRLTPPESGDQDFTP